MLLLSVHLRLLFGIYINPVSSFYLNRVIGLY